MDNLSDFMLLQNYIPNSIDIENKNNYKGSLITKKNTHNL